MNTQAKKHTHFKILATALAGILHLPAAEAAGEFVTAGHLSADDRCRSVGDKALSIQGRRSNHEVPVVWRAGSPTLTFGGGEVKFTVWGNVDLANDIRFTGIRNDGFTIGRKRNGAENAAMGCGARGSVDLTVRTNNFPSAAQDGRLRFGFPVGAAFEIPMRLQPLPAGLDLRWPSRFESSVRVGEHHDCLRANGGHVRVDGDTLEIALNPDNPLPTGCDTYALEVFDLRGVPALRGLLEFRGGDSEPNDAITVVEGNAAAAGFARGQASNLSGLGEMIRRTGVPDQTGRFAALRIDYAAAARALRAAPALQPPSPTASRNVTANQFNRTAAPATGTPPRQIEFNLAMPTFNNIPNLHAPMRVRLVEARAAARSDVAAAFSFNPVCSNLMQVSVQDHSTSSLPITTRVLDGGAGQRVNGGAQPISTVLTYTRPGNYTISLQVSDGSGGTNTARQAVAVPQAACRAAAPGIGAGPIGVGAGSGANLLPARLFPERPTLRRIGGLGANVMIPGGFCAGLGNDARGQANVPALVWGVSSAGGDVASARVELRDDASGRVLSSFDSRVEGNSAAVTRENYPGRPTRVAVVNVTGALMRDFGNQAGCFLDPAVSAPPLDPAFRLVVDPGNAVNEGPDSGAELDNELTF